ncbi:MAG: SIS domain-containing protein [Promethearchaeati archaeon SRVP18_Atabeyarchaeia-1]
MSRKVEYSYDMLKEIHEQPEAIMRTLQKSAPEAREFVELYPLKNFDLIYITGSGTSYHAGLAGQYAMASITKTFMSVIPSSEFRYWVPRSPGKRSMVFAVSQSGESADVLSAATAARENGSTVVAITNTPGSSLTRLAHSTVHTYAGEEKAVTATKTYTSELAAMFTIALAYTEKHEALDNASISRLKRTINEVPHYVEEALTLSESPIIRLADKLASSKFIFMLGSGPNYATALEGALKLKEAAEVFAEGFATREFIHGPMQLISEGTPIIVFMSRGGTQEESLASIMNFEKLGARLIGVTCSEGDEGFGAHLFECIRSRAEIEEIFTPITYIVPIQLLAFHLAVNKGLDPDKPVKLKKVVTS